MAKQTPEGLVLNAVCEYLEYKGYFFWRNNSTGVYDVTNKRFRSIPKHALNGVSDIILLVDGRAMFIEVKSEKGKLSESQKYFKERVEEAGSLYYEVHSLDELIKFGF